jgi:hypothetical protein
MVLMRGWPTSWSVLHAPAGGAPPPDENSAHPASAVGELANTEVGPCLVPPSPLVSQTRVSARHHRLLPSPGPIARAIVRVAPRSTHTSIFHTQDTHAGQLARGGCAMEILYERCCGLDVHKWSGVACLLVPGPEIPS